VPKPRPLKVPLAYVVAGEDQQLASVVNTWIELKRKDGTIDELFAHWILAARRLRPSGAGRSSTTCSTGGSSPPQRYQTIPVFRFQHLRRRNTPDGR
jgi:hypothetical protein